MHWRSLVSKKASLLWIDLEMTGLDPASDRIIEAAAIATDWDFNEIARYQAAIKVDQSIIDQRMIGDFWKKNKKVRKALVENSMNGIGIGQVEKDLLKMIGKCFSKTVYLAGNSIHQDRKFIEREMPKLNSKLHYRMLDVSAWKIVFGEKFKDEVKKPELHRAEDDIEGSIAEMKYYLSKVRDEKS